MRGLAMLANLGLIGPPEVDAELARRGLYIKQFYPEEDIVAPPDYREAPDEPVIVIPGPEPYIWDQDYLPVISPDEEPWEQVTPAPIVEPVAAEPAISKTVMIAGGIVLGALLLFYGRGPRKAPTRRRRRPLRRLAPRAQYPPAEEYPPVEEYPAAEEYAPAEQYEEPEWEEYDVDQD